MDTSTSGTIILGAGLAGLSAGCVLCRAGRQVCVVERDPEVGGLARTVHHRGFRFDLGGHRFIAKDRTTEQFVRTILDGNILVVPRKSKIYLQQKYFDYPLRPANAVLGLGPGTTLRLLADYGRQQVANLIRPSLPLSLEDWVVSKFGRAMYDLYFREYSEKVWGLPCGQISKEWAAKRIDGLSLWEAIKNAFSKRNNKNITTLADRFLYPPRGIGAIPDAMRQVIEETNTVLTHTRVIRVEHKGFTVKNVMIGAGSHRDYLHGDHCVSSIPVTQLVQMLHPAAPNDVLEAAAQLAYRDLVVVTIMLNRERVTELTWIYIPGKEIPFGRIHEPKNWSQGMAPEGKTHLVTEFFCTRGDSTWNSCDEELTAGTVDHLCAMGFIDRDEVFDTSVVRVPQAYPLFTIDYQKHQNTIMAYLRNFKNLHCIGRGGMFRYYNMDHAIESGLRTAEAILQQPRRVAERERQHAGGRRNK